MPQDGIAAAETLHQAPGSLATDAASRQAAHGRRVALGGARLTSSFSKGWPLAATLGLLLLVTAWPPFVVNGSQRAYDIAVIGAAICAAALAWGQSWLGPLLLVAITTVIGTEASGALGAGTPKLGSLRLLDVAALAGASTAGARLLLKRRRPAWPGVRGAVAATVCGAWLVLMWLRKGAPVDAFTHSDLRLIFLLGSAGLVSFEALRGTQPRILAGLVALGPLLAAKAFLIFHFNVWTIGDFDRLQASSVQTPTETRVILIGGDTMLLLIPALAVLLARKSERRTRLLAAVSGLASLGALSISGTRTSLIVAVLLAATAWLGTGFRRTRGSAIIALTALTALTAAGLGTGALSRFTHADAPHTGLAFRQDEVRTALRLPTADLVFGQGLGGRFTSRNIKGQPVTTSWSHVLPVFILLKAGLIGCGAVLAGLAVLTVRSLRRRRSAAMSAENAVGLTILGGLLMASMTLGRAQLPEGVVLIVLALGLMIKRVDGKQLPWPVDG